MCDIIETVNEQDVTTGLEERIFLTVDFDGDFNHLRFLAKDFSGKVHAVKLGEGFFLEENAHRTHLALKRDDVITYHDAKYSSQAEQVEYVLKRSKSLGIDYVSLSGGCEISSMIAASREKNRPELVIALSYGASEIDKLRKVNDELDYPEQLELVMCNVDDIEKVKAAGRFAVIASGIRMPGDKQFDQPAVATPAEALKRGADYLAIGRAITANRHEEQFLAYERILENMASVQ